ncbi:hypothetical protein HELRODRAFT_82010 [Helobdella robusta]|uniref:E3 ubiquitin-protein ligase n=1 Tax=Helobdella robusta TaxID=6412 RepID=T1G4L9_HELRO|nr:hypothetical protein HELRODRAFT_82010 [Helobdella robusta]ESO01419.1 hypothetical protein HELRODRAFT_82010 [Helobdella robusta]
MSGEEEKIGEGKSDDSKKEPETCTICLEIPTNPVKLGCGHSFCGDCLDQNNKKGQQKCPNCGKVYGVIRGNQPDGCMTVKHLHTLHLPSYERCGIIEILYSFPSGKQGENHPNPGKPFKGTHRTAYLPDNKEGNEVLELFQKAFDKRLLFTIGRSVTTGRNDVVVWNDVHQKTSLYAGEYGYPDPTYFDRVKKELADKGIE